MSNPLASYVDKYILNPAEAAHPSVNDDGIGNEETRACISSRITGKEGSKWAFGSVSKLRQKNTEALGERDPRYKGKKTVRKKIHDVDNVSFDPELAKYCLIEDDKESEFSASEDSGDRINNLSNDKESFDSNENDDDFMRMGEEIEESESDEENEDSGEENEDSDEENEDSGDENDDEDEIDSNNLSDEDEGDEECDPAVKTFSSEDSNQISKGKCVKNQCTIYDSLFEARINLQKITSIANQLPQHDKFQDFLQNNNYPQYKVNLSTARKSVKKLMKELLNLQEYLLVKNLETRSVITDMEPDSEEDDDAPESSKNEETDESEAAPKTGTNKRKIDDFQKQLTKRHKALIPFRDETINKWHDKAKLLESQSKKNFANFDIAPAKHIRNILANKDELIKRTQMVGVTRGNVNKILGNTENDTTSSTGDQYDPEIFDDSDFYTRMLEDFLKSKMSLCDDMQEVSRRWISIQKLRKKVKTTMDPKGSKERTLKFHTMSKLQQFLAPCKPSLMEDDATNKLFSSLFGQSEKQISGDK